VTWRLDGVGAGRNQSKPATSYPRPRKHLASELSANPEKRYHLIHAIFGAVKHARQKETIMRERFLSSMIKVAVAAAAVCAVISASITRTSA
jgi:hypothetical protein